MYVSSAAQDTDHPTHGVRDAMILCFCLCTVKSAALMLLVKVEDVLFHKLTHLLRCWLHPRLGQLSAET